MENVTKALLIAAGALLFILLFSLISYLFTQMGGDVSNIYADLTESDVTEYNQVLLNYDGRDDLTVQDVVSIINFALDNREVHGYVMNTEIYITWSDRTTSYIQSSNSSTYDSYNPDSVLEDELQQDAENLYTCEVDYAENTKLVGTIIITPTTT